jgi:hypothetical protein
MSEIVTLINVLNYFGQKKVKSGFLEIKKPFKAQGI